MFRFKQFSVSDDKSTMKVGTDAVLLGAWADVSNSKTILDIGTGCGVIALMLAQRMPSAKVDAVEIDAASAQQAEENFKSSVFANRLEVYNTTIQEFPYKQYDLIVSNPPFFSKSLLPPDPQRLVARHTETLSFDDLLLAVKSLLRDDGRFALILPVAEGNLFLEKARYSDLHCNRKTAVYPRNKLERFLFEFSRAEKTPVEDELVLHDGDRRSEVYQRLAEEFYIG